MNAVQWVVATVTGALVLIISVGLWGAYQVAGQLIAVLRARA